MLIFGTIAALPTIAKGLLIGFAVYGGGGFYAHATDPVRKKKTGH